ncbi:hypothetical protein AB0933_20285 [Streptomyces venezuelae]|uniref:hypothetical protein n=1 Tax=Streptomyces venezuelae TaxID=54571 RepID=UPI0034519C0E
MPDRDESEQAPLRSHAGSPLLDACLPARRAVRARPWASNVQHQLFLARGSLEFGILKAVLAEVGHKHLS